MGGHDAVRSDYFEDLLRKSEAKRAELAEKLGTELAMREIEVTELKREIIRLKFIIKQMEEEGEDEQDV